MANDSKTIRIGLYILSRPSMHSDEVSQFLVGANGEAEARQIANSDSKAEGYVWTDPARTDAKFLGFAEDGVYGVIMRSKEPI